MRHSRRSPARRLRAGSALLMLSLSWVVAAEDLIVISQIYGGGGNSGATYTHDFIELYNRGAEPVDLAGWSVQYASATGGSWARTDLAGTIPPGRHLLVQQAAGAGGTTALPTPDATGTIAMSATAGKVALRTNQTPLTGTDPVGMTGVIDAVGYGSAATGFEGSGPAPTLGNATAALRLAAGATDTDDNAADFASGAPNPRNLASGGGPVTTPPSGTGSAAPSNPAVGDSTLLSVLVVPGTAPTSAGLSVIADLSAIGGSPTQAFVDDGTGGDAAPGDGRFSFTATIAPGTSAGATSIPVLLADDQGRSGSAAIALTVSSSIPGPWRIHDIQGAGHISPLAGQAVVNVPGIVTAVRSNGFHLQDPLPDADPATSEGILVFTGSAPSVTVGQEVLVSGTVVEFRAGGAEGVANLTITEIAGPLSVSVRSSGQPLPPTILIGPAGRMPPTTVIDDDAAGDVETSGTFDTASDGIDFWESLEGMRLEVIDAVAVGPTSGFGEIPVLAAGGSGAGLRTVRGGILVRPGDFNPERLFIDDVIVANPPQVSVGDRFSSAIVGVLDYSFGNFKLLNLGPLPVVVPGGLSREATTLAGGGGAVTVATYNVENLDPGDSTFAQHAEAIVANLGSPDILCLEEIQDDNGSTNDGTVSADLTFQTLIAAIQTAGGPLYDHRSIAPQDLQDGGEPGGNIRVGFLFRPDRVAFVDRAGGTATSATAVLPGPVLSASPGRIDPLNPAFANSRKPLAGEFMVGSRRLFVIANHFNSKGGDQPLFGRFQPPAFPSETQRALQARAVHDFVAAIIAEDADADVVVLGDFNDFDFSQALAILEGTVLNNLADLLPEAERYDYVFEGNSQTLDHILVSDHLFAAAPQVDIVHINAEFADQISDHDPIVARFALNTAPTVGLGADVAIPAGGALNVTAAFADPDVGDTWTATVDYGDGSDTQSLAIGTGQTLALGRVYPTPGVYTVTVTVTDAGGASGQDSLEVTVDAVAAWRRDDIGLHLLPGSTAHDDDRLLLTGSGLGFNGRRDGATAVTRPLIGNGAIVARLDALTAWPLQAFAGVSIRESADDDARHLTIGLSERGVLRVLTREAPSGGTRLVASRRVGSAPPLWLRVSRLGDGATASSSADGVTWTVEGAVMVALGTSPRAGLVVTSGSILWPGLALFSHVQAMPVAMQ